MGIPLQWKKKKKNGSDVLIPIDIADPLLPLHRLALSFLDVPLPFSTVNLPSVILTMAGYRVIMADSPDGLAPPGSHFFFFFRMASSTSFSFDSAWFVDPHFPTLRRS